MPRRSKRMPLRVDQELHVPTKGAKKIMHGALRKITRAAQAELCVVFARPVHLYLTVKVRKYAHYDAI